MNRKVIKQGRRSLTLTLPVKWVKDREIAEGDELELVPSGDFLIVGTKKPGRKRSISLEVKTSSSTVKKLIANLYRSGYDEISIVFDDVQTGTHIYDIVLKQMVGYEIIKLHDNHFLIKDIADLDPKSFDILFQKCFLLLLNFQRELHHHFEAKNRTALELAVLSDIEINKVTNLCQRLLNKKLNDRRKIAALSTVLKGIEYIGDELKDLALSYLEKETFPSLHALEILDYLGQKLQIVYLQYKNFNLEKLLQISNELRQKRAELDINELESRFFHSIMKKMELLIDGALVLELNPEDKMTKEDWVP